MVELSLFVRPSALSLLHIGEVFVAVIREAHGYNMVYLQRTGGANWYAPLDSENVINDTLYAYPNTLEITFYKLTDAEKMKHVAWRVL